MLVANFYDNEGDNNTKVNECVGTCPAWHYLN